MTWVNTLREKFNQGEDLTQTEINQLLVFAEETVKAINQLSEQAETYNTVSQEPKVIQIRCY